MGDINDKIEHFRELMQVQFEFIGNALTELKEEVKKLNNSNLPLRVETLETTDKKIIVELNNLGEKLSNVEKRIKEMEHTEVNCGLGVKTEMYSLKKKVNELEKRLHIIFLIAENPKAALIIAIGLYLYAISGNFSGLVKNIF
jgi:polyhydroxyalkanoate synthesis regulator phasin